VDFPLFCFGEDMGVNPVKQRVYELAARAAEEEGYELEKAEVLGSGRRMIVRIVIDKEGGVNISDCERMSRGFEALLDVEDPIKGSYTLEVSSPGLDRPLNSQKDFDKSIGKLVRIITKETMADNQTFFIGRLIDAGEGWVRISIEKKGGNQDLFIPLEKISKAKLEIEF
jgi:ribosome maturation factor RimP